MERSVLFVSRLVLCLVGYVWNIRIVDFGLYFVLCLQGLFLLLLLHDLFGISKMAVSNVGHRCLSGLDSSVILVELHLDSFGLVLGDPDVLTARDFEVSVSHDVSLCLTDEALENLDELPDRLRIELPPILAPLDVRGEHDFDCRTTVCTLADVNWLDKGG